MENVVVASFSWPLTAPPWLDLPQHLTEMILQRLSARDCIRFAAVCRQWRSIQREQQLTELILERLPLPDYIRFAAVCTKWRCIQRVHRICHAPLSPPMLTLPWLCILQEVHDFDSITCYNPFEGKLYSFPLPEAAVRKDPVGSSHGWLMLCDFHASNEHRTFLLLDPVSGAHLPLPLLPEEDYGLPDWSMSSPPTDPNCVVMTTSLAHVSLWRVGDSDWTRLPRPIPYTNHRDKVDVSIFYKGKFYCKGHNGDFFVVDPVAFATGLLDMGFSHPPLTMTETGTELWRVDRLVESNGDLLMVMLFFPLHDVNRSFQGLQVFKADFSRKMWTEVESLGNHVLFLSLACSFSMLAEDVGVTGNCIFFKDCFPSPDYVLFEPHLDEWTRFDLETGRVVHGLPISNADLGEFDSIHLQRRSIWITPCLNPVDPGLCRC